MAKQRNCLTERLRQTGLLVRKNFRILYRNKSATITQLLVPFIFVAILFLLQLAVDSNARRNVQIRLTENSVVEPIGNFPRCIIGYSNTKCYTLAFTPSTDVNANATMMALAEQNGIPPEEIIGFRTEADANRYLATYPNVTQAVVHFRFDYNCDPAFQTVMMLSAKRRINPTSLTAEEGTVLAAGSEAGSDLCHSQSFDKSALVGVRYLLQYNRTIIYVKGKAVNPVTYIQLPLQRAVDRALFETFGNNVTFDYDLRAFTHPDLVLSSIVSSVGQFFFFGALMFNFVVQISNIVLEKELNLRESMRVMGLLDFSYWLSWMIVNLWMNIISSMLLIAAGAIFQFDFFLKNDFLTYFYLFVLFGMAMVPLAFFVSTLLNNTSTATTLGFAVFLFGVMIQSFTGQIYQDTTDLVWRILFAFLPFAMLAKGLGDLNSYTNSPLKFGLRFDKIGEGFFPLTEVFWWLAIDFGVFLILALFLDNVLYSRRKVWFFLQPSYWTGSRKRKPHKDEAAEEFVVEDVDEDVKAEEDYIKSGQTTDNDAVIIEDLIKTYQKKVFGCIPTSAPPFRAVKGVNLTIQKGTLLCLLGHNGAGKTTTIKMLTGLFPPTSGDATIFGNSIIEGMNDIRQVMGVCPQHDILWRQLTAREHLELFAGLKDLPEDQIAREVEERLNDVSLTAAADIPAGSYSGGMKRRLSVAIALIGDPKIVFLDEPTTGMDPVSRRGVWNLIERVKRGRVTLLTTHSMEEADILGDKIAIMKGGRIATVGTSLRLKNRFGSGYTVSVIASESKMEDIKNFIFSSFDLNKRLSIDAPRKGAEIHELEDSEEPKKKAKSHKKKHVESSSSSSSSESSASDSSSESETDESEQKHRPKAVLPSDIGPQTGQVELVSQVQSVITFKIPLRFAPRLPDFFEGLETIKKKLGIRDFQLSMTTLEEVFLRVAEEPNVEEKKKDKKKSSKKKIIIGLIVAAIILMMIIVGAVIGARRAHRSQPQADYARNRTSEPLPFIPPSGSWNASFFPYAIIASDVTVSSAWLSVWTNGTDLLTMHLYAAQGNQSWALVNTTTGLAPSNGFQLQLEVSSLEKDTAYSVYFVAESSSSNSGVTRFRTAPSADDSPRRIVFGATSSLGRSDAPWETLGFAAKENFDFFVLAGDSICPTVPTPTEIRSKWMQTMGTEGFRNLSSSTSFIATMNDQEFAAFGTPALGRQIFNQVFPTRNQFTGSLTRSLRWGSTVELFILDVRSNRNTTTKEIISKQDMDWLKEGLTNSTAKFKIIVSGSPFSNAAALQLPLFDIWTAFTKQREELRDHIVNGTGIRGTFFVSGDFQFGALASIEPVPPNTERPKYRLKWGGHNITEVAVGPSGTRINPYTVYNARLALASRQFPTIVDTWTYTRFSLEPNLGELNVQFIDDLGNIIDEKSVMMFLPHCENDGLPCYPCPSGKDEAYAKANACELSSAPAA